MWALRAHRARRYSHASGRGRRRLAAGRRGRRECQHRVTGSVETSSSDSVLRVRGWIVDDFSATRPDLVEVEDLAGRRLAEVGSGAFVRRRDVEARFGATRIR